MKTLKIAKKSTPQNTDVLFNAPANGKRALIYSRVSTQDQDAQNQVAQLKGYADAQGWEVVDAITDTCSGSTSATERAGLSKVLTLAHQRRFDIILFWSLDRFSREGSRKTIGYLTELEQFGVGWHSFTEPYISTLGVVSDAIIALLSALAKQERLRIAGRLEPHTLDGLRLLSNRRSLVKVLNESRTSTLMVLEDTKVCGGYRIGVTAN